MNAKKCNRCGTYYDENSKILLLGTDKSELYGFETIDLCEICSQEFEKWLKKED